MRRGRPLAVWGGLLVCAGLWLAQRWPAMHADQRQLALALAAADQPAMAAGPPAERPRLLAAAAVVVMPLPSAPAPLQRAVQVASHRALAPALPVVQPMSPPGQPVSDLPPPQQVSPTPLPASPAPAPPAPPASAYRLAEAAYARLAEGQRRPAAALFDAALALEPGNRQWQQDRAALRRRWQMGGFALLRDGGGSASGPAASPVLGGGQLGASVAVLADLLARRPLALVARAFVAADTQGVQRETAQAAIGLRQTLVPGVTLSAERLIALGSATRGDWTLRLAGGGRSGRLDAYGEAGVLGSGQIYGGAQASARLLRLGPAALAAAGWASVQTGSPDVWRVDVGPSVSAQWRGLRLQADWRQRVAGNAAPGSGPVVTISAGF
jgi:hypothetical protein